MLFWKVKHELLGGHVHARFFVAKSANQTFACCGELVMTADDWADFLPTFCGELNVRLEPNPNAASQPHAGAADFKE